MTKNMVTVIVYAIYLNKTVIKTNTKTNRSAGFF